MAPPDINFQKFVPIQHLKKGLLIYSLRFRWKKPIFCCSSHCVPVILGFRLLFEFNMIKNKY